MSTSTALQLLNDNDLIGMLPFDDRKPVAMWQDVVRTFEAADNKGAAVVALRQEYAGRLKISQSTLYRKAEAYKAEGVIALFPVRARKRVLKQTSLPAAFITWWHTLACESQRMVGTAAAYRSLFNDHLIPGRVIPGYETDWRGIWSSEHGGAPAPQVCPYIPDKTYPKGWSERNLRGYLPDRAALAMARMGTLAGREHLPKLPSTRVGLRFGSVFIADDRYHDAQVKFAGNLGAQGVVELGAIELLSAHYCTWGAKPIRERSDGTREHLREAFMRYLVVDILCRIGYDPMGCQIIGEHGTARLPTDLQESIDRKTAGKVKFTTGAILNAPIAKGLLPGAARGNYRMKAALESAHSRYKNDLALLPGQKGADPEHAPEDLQSKQSYHRALMKACIALAEQNPELLQRVSTPFPEYYQYLQAVGLIYDRIADDQHHRLEGFAQSGLSVDEFSLFGDDWRPMAALDNLPPEQRQAIVAALRMNPRSQRPRVMSRREAFAYLQRTSDLMRLPDSLVPELLGPQLGDELAVQMDGVFAVRDKYLPNVTYQVAAVCVLPSGCHQRLDRGTRWLVHLNPLSASEAFVSTLDGVYVGKAPVLVAGTKSAPNPKNMAILNEMERGILKQIAPVAEKRIRERGEAMEANIELFTGRRPLDEIHALNELREQADQSDLTEADYAAAGARDTDHESMDLEEITHLLGREQ